LAGSPPPCRWCPFTTYQAPTGPATVRLSYLCPAVLANRGAGHEEHIRQLDEDAAPLPLPGTYRLGTHDLDGRSYEQLEAHLAGILGDSPDLGRGLALGARVNACVSSRLADGGTVEDALASLSGPAAQEELERTIRPFRNARDARLLCAPFVLVGLPTSQGWSSILRNAVSLISGRGTIRTALSSGPIDLEVLRSVQWDPGTPTTVLRRYLLNLHLSRAMLADYGVEQGFLMIGAAYALVRWYARAAAASDGRSAATEGDAVEAIRLVELFYIHHNRTLHHAFTRTPVGSVLGSILLTPGRLAGLVLENRSPSATSSEPPPLPS
ncbi:MAG: hypothetical protein HY815_03385, partial [Candidatus Riflebacteria bacterium]|nr:hypothetical protein [Candidatus Riflebacteria bacterium]